MQEKTSIDIIVINWNAGHQLRQALLPTLEANLYTTLSISSIVIDNGSSDQSLATIRDLPVRIVESKTNLGFGKACNKALPFGQGEFILLLNPDTNWKMETLEKLATVLLKQPDVACVGPMQLNSKNEAMRTCSRFPNFFTALWDTLGFSKAFPTFFQPAPIMIDWDHQTSKLVNHVMGSFMLLRRSVINQIGFFDEDYFMYYEDLDLSKRIANAGFKTWYSATESIYHKGGGTSEQIKARRLYYSLKSKQTYWKKHFSFSAYLFLTVVSITAEPLIRMLVELMKGKFSNVVFIGEAYAMLWKSRFK